jgi:hypothetical protein
MNAYLRGVTDIGIVHQQTEKMQGLGVCCEVIVFVASLSIPGAASSCQ